MGSYVGGAYSGKGSSSSYSSSSRTDTALEKVIALLQKVSDAAKTVDKKESELKEARETLARVQNEATKEISKLDPTVVSTISKLFGNSGFVNKMIEVAKDDPETEL